MKEMGTAQENRLDCQQALFICNGINDSPVLLSWSFDVTLGFKSLAILSFFSMFASGLVLSFNILFSQFRFCVLLFLNINFSHCLRRVVKILLHVNEITKGSRRWSLQFKQFSPWDIWQLLRFRCTAPPTQAGSRSIYCVHVFPWKGN